MVRIKKVYVGYPDNTYVAFPAEPIKHEPCEDCVSREAVLEILRKSWLSGTVAHRIIDDIGDKIWMLPPVTPKQRMGKWVREPIRNKKGGCIGAKMICSKCGNDNKHDEYMDYCPNCGCKMEGEKE